MRPLYIFDLDGTLANIEHRLNCIQNGNRDYTAFYMSCDKDEPVKSMIRICQSLKQTGSDVWIWTGRSKQVMIPTLYWLLMNGVINIDEFISIPLGLTDSIRNKLRMRDIDDHRKDAIIKEGWLNSLALKDRSRLVAVFEDRSSVVDMWRLNGIRCLQVCEGNY